MRLALGLILVLVQEKEPVFFAGPAEGLEERARAHWIGDAEAIRKLRPPSADEEVFVHLLFGGSPNGHDPLRQTTASVQREENRITVSVGSDRTIPLNGNKGMQDVRFSLGLGKLKPGKYSVSVTGSYLTFEGPKKVGSEFALQVVEPKK